MTRANREDDREGTGSRIEAHPAQIRWRPTIGSRYLLDTCPHSQSRTAPSQRYTRLDARLLKDLAASVELVSAARSFAQTFRKPVAIPAPPTPANAPDFRFEPVVKGGDPYLKYYIAGLLPFASARIAATGS